MKLIVVKSLIGLFVVFLLTACGEEISGTNSTNSLPPVTGPGLPTTGSSSSSDYLQFIGAGNSSNSNIDPNFWNELISNAKGNIYTVSSRDEFNNAARSAAPGDVILVANGTYQWSNLSIPSTGTKQDPIIYTAQNEGGVTFRNVSTLFNITGNHNIIGGFTIDDIDDKVFGLTTATDNRITDNTINRPGPTTDTTKKGWLEISQQSHRNRFDHNIVDAAINRIRVLLNTDAVVNGPSQDIRIDHNTFRNSTKDAGMVLQLGQGEPSYPGSADLETRLIFEYNLIDNHLTGTNGVIQVKSSRNIIRYNEIKDSAGGLYQRNGKYNEWYGNYIHGTGGGNAIAISGAYHKFYNNIVDCPNKRGLNMPRWGSRPPLGEFGGSSPIPPTHDILIAHNTFLDYGSRLDYGMRIGGFANTANKAIYNIDVVNNIIIGDVGDLIRYTEGDYSYYLDVYANGLNDVNINNNIYYATGSAVTGNGASYDVNAIIGNPNLSGFNPTASSTLVIDQAVDIIGTPITLDFNEDIRSGTYDVGAVAYSY